MSLVQLLRSLWAQVTAGKVAAAFVLYWLLKRIKRAYTKVLLAKKIILVTGGANGEPHLPARPKHVTSHLTICCCRHWTANLFTVGKAQSDGNHPTRHPNQARSSLPCSQQTNKHTRQVVIWDIDATALEAARGTIMEAVPDSTVHTHRVDLSDRHQIYAAATRIRDEVGPVYGVINNAGIVSGKEQLVQCSSAFKCTAMAAHACTPACPLHRLTCQMSTSCGKFCCATIPTQSASAKPLTPHHAHLDDAAHLLSTHLLPFGPPKHSCLT